MNQVRLGTRRSALALAQTERVKGFLQKKFPETIFTIVPISTSGDDDKKTPLSELGGKGVFIKGLEKALLDGDIDIAIHSFKDVTSHLENGCELSGFLVPETQADCIVYGRDHAKIPVLQLAHEFDQKSLRLGTGSARRQSWVQDQRSMWQCVPIRGNVETRLAQIGKTVDAVMLSFAGLVRLNLEGWPVEILDVNDCIPAPGQGVICLETLVEKEDLKSMCAAISDSRQMFISTIEFEILKQLGFDCTIPLGMYSSFDDGVLTIDWAYSNPGSDQRHTGFQELEISESQAKDRHVLQTHSVKQFIREVVDDIKRR